MSQVEKEIKIIKKQIVSVLILFFMFVMIFAIVSPEMIRAQNNESGNTTLAQTITSGYIVLTNPSTLTFDDAVAGTAQNSLKNLNGVNVSDNRGTGGGWTLTLYAEANNFVGQGSNYFSANRALVTPGTVTADDDGNVTAGSAFNLEYPAANASNYMVAASGYGKGMSNIEDSVFNLSILADDLADGYNVITIFTLTPS